MIDPLAPPGAAAASPISALAGRAPPATALAAGGFGAVLGQMASEAAATLRVAEASSILGVRGEVPVQKVVEAVMAAEQTLQAALAIRDKVTAAYLELSRMAI